MFGGAPGHPQRLRAPERALLAALAGHAIEHPEQPRSVRLECPERLLAELEPVFGAALERELAALREPAPLDLRVNTLATTRDEALRSLSAARRRRDAHSVSRRSACACSERPMSLRSRPFARAGSRCRTKARRSRRCCSRRRAANRCSICAPAPAARRSRSRLRCRGAAGSSPATCGSGAAGARRCAADARARTTWKSARCRTSAIAGSRARQDASIACWSTHRAAASGAGGAIPTRAGV